GNPLGAYDVATEGLSRWPSDRRLRQIQALALVDSGARDRGAELLRQLVAEGAADEETLGILARTYKDAWSQASDPAQRVQHLRRAIDAYADAYRRTGGYWTGINAATCARLLDQPETARSLARAVRTQCVAELRGQEADANGRFYPLVSLGEVALILG